MKDVNKRRDILRDQKRCYLCLRSGHCAFECENGKMCPWCNGKHHQSICPKVTKTPQRKKSEEAPKQDMKKEVPKQEEERQNQSLSS